MKTIKEVNLVITHRCNLNCIYCYESHKDSKEMSLEMAKDIVKHCLSTKTCDEFAINLFGGEPMLRFPFVKSLCEWTWSRDWPQEYQFYADTNGVNLSQEVKEWTSLNCKRFIMLLSLDGTPSTHNLNRSNSFDKIDLKFFKQNWPTVGVKMTVSDLHLENLAEDIIFLHSQGFKIKGSNIAEGFIIEDFNHKFNVLKEQYKILINWYIQHPQIEVAQLFDLNLSICESHKKERMRYCGCGTDAIKVIDVDGKEYPCTYFFPLSMNPHELDEVLKNDLKNENLFINDDCRENCYIYPICKGCYGDNYSTTGKFSCRSPQKCKLAKLRALSVATLQAQRMLLEDKTVLSEEERNTIIAIKNINLLFSKIGEADSQKEVEA